MYQRMSEELARHRLAEVQRPASGRYGVSLPARSGASAGRDSAGRNSAVPASALPAGPGRARDAVQSLRARAGWKLVDLGLKLAVTPDSRTAAAPRPAGS